MLETVELQDMDSDIGCADNTGGILKILIGYHQDVATWPTIPAVSEVASIAEFGTLEGDLVMATGKKLVCIRLPQNKGSLTISEQGEQGGMSHLMEVVVRQDGITPEILGLMGATKNANLVGIVVDTNGQAYLLGDSGTPMRRVAGDGAVTGASRTDLRNVGVKFQYPVNSPRIYLGDMDSLIEAAV